METLLLLASRVALLKLSAAALPLATGNFYNDHVRVALVHDGMKVYSVTMAKEFSYCVIEIVFV